MKKVFSPFRNKIFLTGFAITISITCFFVFGQAGALNTGEIIKFNVDKDYDVAGREEVLATMVNNTQNLYFYIEKNWWDSQNVQKQQEIISNLNYLSQEFSNKIYPTLTSVYGQEWRPGIDGDSKIIILFHSMKPDAGGYFRTADEYLKIQAPDSNEKEMLYISLSVADNPQLKVFLAHEFVHLITFNQKNKNFGVEEEVWLNEARAEYASTVLGYDEPYDGSSLKKRVELFLAKPSDSITEWQGTKYDYGSTTLFAHYLVDQYGAVILSSSLKSRLIGIDSINEALSKNGFKENFQQAFVDWTIAVFLNDCSLGKRYCYYNKNLQSLRISPSINFLPLTSKSTLSIVDVTKNWSGNWQKFIGGNSVLKLDFASLTGLYFKVPYLLQKQDNTWTVNFLSLNENQKGEISIADFGEKYKALVLIPSLQSKFSGFDGLEPTYPYTITVSVSEKTEEEESVLMQQLLAQIENLKKEIARIQALLDAALGKNSISCSGIQNNLYLGLANNSQVRCLQEFLKSQPGIYPKGIITGNFGPLTFTAVIRFQEKYAFEILAPYGLTIGNGYVGPKTILKINQLLRNS